MRKLIFSQLCAAAGVLLICGSASAQEIPAEYQQVLTALHNHFFWDEPRMFYMHVHGHGSPAELARRVKPAIDLIGKNSHGAAPPAPSAASAASSLDTAKLAKIAGHDGEQTGAVYKITV